MHSIIIIVVLGLLYYLFVTLTGLSLCCPFRAVTGYMCPGCGITTMFLRLAELDLQGAYTANPFLFVTMPLLLFEIGYSIYGSRSKWNEVLLICYIIALIAFGFIRNI